MRWLVFHLSCFSKIKTDHQKPSISAFAKNDSECLNDFKSSFEERLFLTFKLNSFNLKTFPMRVHF